MRNLTITVDEETSRWARIEAARNDTSVSRFVGSILQDLMKADTAYERSRSSWAARTPRSLNADGSRYPSRDEVHAR